MKYTVIARFLELSHGVVGLTAEQADLRKHALKKKGKGRYEIIAPVQFKAGEVLEFDQELPKKLATLVEPELSAKQKKETEAKAKEAAEAEAKAKAEAEAQAKADQEAREKAEAEAKVVWEGSEELKAKFPEFDLYLASLNDEQPEGEGAAAGEGGQGGSEEGK